MPNPDFTILDRSAIKVDPLVGTTGIESLTFAPTAQVRPDDLLPDQWVLWDDHMGYDRGLYSTATVTGNPTVSFADGFKKFACTSGNGNPRDQWNYTSVAPVAPYYCCELWVGNMAGSGAFDEMQVGLYKDANNFVTALYQKQSNQFAIWVKKTGGTNATVATFSKTISASTPFKMRFVLHRTTAACYYNLGQGWVLACRFDVSASFDFGMTSVLSTFRPAFWALADATATISVDRFRHGYCGSIGVQNPNLVRWLDGTPYVEAGKHFVALTNGGLGGDIASVHSAVYSVDLDSGEVVETAKHFVRREGRVVGDCAGGVVFDPDRNVFIWTPGSWGTFGDANPTVTYHIETGANLLRGVHIFDDPGTLNIPTSTSVYDVEILWFGGYYYVCYTETDAATGWSTYYPCLARGTSLSSLSVVAKATSYTGYEGTKLSVGGGTLRVIASNATVHRIFSVEDMSSVGTVNCVQASGVTPAAHLTPIPVMRNEKTEYFGLQMDGRQHNSIAWSHGNLWIQKATATNAGYEFAIREAVFR